MSWFSKVFGGKKEEETKDADAAKKDAPPEGDEKEVNPEEADEVLAEDNRSLIRQLISANGLSMGMDLHKITLPTFILEPRSLLEKIGDITRHPELFSTCADAETPEERMVNVLRWYLSAYHVRPKGAKKPYNPVLGETFMAKYKAGCFASGNLASPKKPESASAEASASEAEKKDEAAEKKDGDGDDAKKPDAAPAADKTEIKVPKGSDVEYYAQQVSHHPPVTSFFARNEEGTVALMGCFAPKTKFQGNSAASMGGGGFRILMPKRDNEMYFCTWPNAFVRGILFGTLLMELGGTVNIRCPNSDLTAQLEFVTKGYFSGQYHAVKGTIFRGKEKKGGTELYQIEGEWVGKTTIKNVATGETSTLFDKTVFPLGHYDDIPFDEEAAKKEEEIKRMWNTRTLWADLTEAIKKNDQKAATEAKTKVEEHQRKLRAQRTEEKVDYELSLFDKNEDGSEWVYKGPNKIEFPPLGQFTQKKN